MHQKETGYQGGGRLREQCWRQTAVQRQLKTTLKYILAAAWEQRRRESGSHREDEGGEEGSGSGSDGRGKGGRRGLLGVLGQIRVVPRWVDDPVRIQDRRI